MSAILLTFLLAATTPPTITCEPTLTEQQLIQRHGKANVTRGMVYIAEGDETPGTIVFPKDETKRMEIVWHDAKQRKRVDWIRIPAGSVWTVAGLRSGMPLPDIEKLNGRPLKLSGFDWDYGGSVIDWRGGQLAKAGAPCRVQITFDREVPETLTRAQEKAVEKTSGDRELLSSSPDLRMFKVRVGEIVLDYPE